MTNKLFKKDALDKLNGAVQLLGLDLGIDLNKLETKYTDSMRQVEDLKKELEATKKSKAVVTLKAKKGIIQEDWHNRLATDLKLGRTVAVVGPAGNGKSTGVKTALETLGYNIYHIDCTDSTTVETLVGGLEPTPDGKGGISLEFKDGLFIKAFKDAKGAIQMDEFDALDPRVAMALQSALHRAMGSDAKRFVASPDHPKGGVNAKGLCPIVVTMNTFGSGATREYIGRNTLDSASMDRFDSIISTDYSHEVEKLVQKGFKKQTAQEVTNWAATCRKEIARQGLRILLSTRRLISVCESMDILCMSLEEAVWKDFAERLEPMDRDALKLAKPEPKSEVETEEEGKRVKKKSNPSLGVI